MTIKIKTCPGCEDAAIRASLPEEERCAKCRKKERNRLWRLAHPNANAERSRAWRQAGNKSPRSAEYHERRKANMRKRYNENQEYRDNIKERVAQYRRENPEKVRESVNRWVEKNRDKVRGYVRGWNSRNREKVSEIVAAWRAANPEKRALYAAKRNAALAAVSDTLENGHLSDLMKWQQGHCFYTGQRITRENKTLDHIIPLALGGPNHISNVAWASSSANYSKQERLFGVEWNPENADFSDLKLITEHTERYATASSFAASCLGNSGLIAFKAEHPSLPIFWDFEWQTRRSAIENMISESETIGARECEVIRLTPQQASVFYNTYHIQGAMGAAEHWGLSHNGEIVAALSAGNGVLHRFCTKGRVAGALSRLLSKVPKPLFTFCEPRHGTGKAYEKVGFERLPDSASASYGYIRPPGEFVSRHRMQNPIGAVNHFIPGLGENLTAQMNGMRKLEGLHQMRFILR